MAQPPPYAVTVMGTTDPFGNSSYPTAGGPPMNPSIQHPGRGLDVPCSLVELRLSAKDLVDMDVFSKSDPMCVVYIKQFGARDFVEVGRTEVVWNQLNPRWATKFELQYFFEERQFLRFEVYDIDNESRDLSSHDFLGSCECSLGEIVSNATLNAYEKPLQGPHRKCGFLHLQVEELSSSKEVYQIQFECLNLHKKSWFFGSSPFYEIHKSNEGGSYSLVYRSDHISGNCNPVFPEKRFTALELCNGDLQRNLRIMIWHYQSNGSHGFIGECYATMERMFNGPYTFPLMNQKKGYEAGTFKVLKIRRDEESSFLDYVMAGVQLNCTVAIDFTASNGNPRDPASLHFHDAQRPNQYQIALRAVLDIIQDYDSDKLFPALGFGAKVPPSYNVSHEFFLNLRADTPFCQGVEGVMNAYSTSLNVVQLYGPTNFAPVITHVARFAEQNQTGSDYFILLILTDGIITDMPQTISSIVRTSSLPVSIIIVGVGDADFGDMDVLDADDTPLVANGTTMKRDIVQFVPFNKIVRQFNNNLQLAKMSLAKEVLAEIPKQFTSWYKQRGLKPDTVPTASRIAVAGGASAPPM